MLCFHFLSGRECEKRLTHSLDRNQTNYWIKLHLENFKFIHVHVDACSAPCMHAVSHVRMAAQVKKLNEFLQQNNGNFGAVSGNMRDPYANLPNQTHLYPRLHFGFLLSNVCTSIFPETVCNVRKVHRIPRTCEWMELVGFDGTSECSFMQKFALCAPSFHQR